MNENDSKSKPNEKQKQIDSFESRRTRFNIDTNISKKSDISNTWKTLMYGFMRNNIIDKKSVLYSNDLPMELLLLIYSFYHMLVIHFGIRFYYWDYYKNLSELSEEEHFNINDHSGYDICDLFIIPRYGSFKEEISFYKHISVQQYKNILIPKINGVMKTSTTNKIKANNTGRHYGINRDDPVTFSHLLSVALFTDFSELCVDFKNSFCSTSEMETVQHIKTRNSYYYWMSKYLREVVEVYGVSGGWYYDRERLSGPFFASCSIPLVVSEFNVRICLPMSTSRKLEMAKSFAGSKGIVLQFNNPEIHGCAGVSGFDCSFISKCPQESEIIFMGGQYYIQLQTVIMMQNDQNFVKFIYALYYLDTILTASSQHRFQISKNEVWVIKNLFSNILNKKTTLTFDQYIYDTFAAFIERKKQIVFDLNEIYETTNSEFRDLLMNRLNRRDMRHEQEVARLDTDFSNLFLSEMLLVFHNVNTIIINTTNTGYGYANSYSLSMICLLSLIESASLNKVIVKANSFYEGDNFDDDNSDESYSHSSNKKTNSNWIKELWCSDEKRIKKYYQTKNYNIAVKILSKNYTGQIIDHFDSEEYWFVITKKT